MIRIDGEDSTISLSQTSIDEQDFLEDDLRNWILDDPHAILGEDVLLVGHEVPVKGIGDAIDLLAIDRDGNVVVIELKQGRITGNVDFQALKYAAYASHWDYEQLRDQFESFKSTSWGQAIYDEETTFREALEDFCNEDYTPNQDQRILLVGETLADRLDLVARWLSDRDVDITIVEVQLFADDGRVYLDAEQKVPVPEQSPSEVNPDTSKKPWKGDGRDWHLTEVSNDETATLLSEVVTTIGEIEFLDGPHWGQKQYISFRQDRKNRVIARTQKTQFNVEIYDIKVGDVEAESIATTLDVPKELVQVEPEDLRGGRSGIRITCRPGQEMDPNALREEIQQRLTQD